MTKTPQQYGRRRWDYRGHEIVIAVHEAVPEKEDEDDDGVVYYRQLLVTSYIDGSLFEQRTGSVEMLGENRRTLRRRAKKMCRNIGKVSGRTTTTRGSGAVLINQHVPDDFEAESMSLDSPAEHLFERSPDEIAGAFERLSEDRDYWKGRCTALEARLERETK